jgi:UDP-sugar pyrophosphorylase
MDASHFFSQPLPPEAAGVFDLLLALGQEHLFADWEAAGLGEAEKLEFLQSLLRVHSAYPGGLEAYVTNSRYLLAQSRDCVNPYEGFEPGQPDAIDLSGFGDAYDRAEQRGRQAASGLAVVMVAGGLGERLGHAGIKIDIPAEVTCGTSYLALCAAYLRALGARVNTRIPFIIMTSDATHEGTIQSLEKNVRFGLERDQVHVIKQQLVPAFRDNDARLAKDSRYRPTLKPHGHGDVHRLLHGSGLAARLHREGRTHLAFIQDTNGQVLNSLLAALGVSVQHGFTYNSMAVSRIHGEAAGAIVRLRGMERELTLNVEYNQLHTLPKPDGDVAGPDRFSKFPGNINALIVELGAYVAILERTAGIIPEFVNPKYTDAARTIFRPARLETMMQDLPKLFGPEHRTGVTVFDRRWCFSPNKNDPVAARNRAAQQLPPESAASAESDFYHAMRFKAAQGGIHCPLANELDFGGVPFEHGAHVIFDPSFVLTLAEAGAKIQGGSLGPDTTLVVRGEGVRLENVVLLGRAGLLIEAAPGASLRVENLTLDQDGFEQLPLSAAQQASDATPSSLKMRGYRIERRDPLVINATVPGRYVVGPDGNLRPDA